MESITRVAGKQGSEEAETKLIQVGELLSYLGRVKDSRKQRGKRYDLTTILILFILAKLCGQNKIYGIADWVQQHGDFLVTALQLRCKRLPHHSTYRRVLGEVVNEEELEQIVAAYLAQLPRTGQEVVVVLDGKTLRGTITREDPFGLHLLAAYLPGEGLVLMQMVVERDKENEIVVAPKLMECLDLRQKVVTGDAMHTQRQISSQIVAAGGDFVWMVKDNQPETRRAIELLFAPEPTPIPGQGNPPKDFRSAKTVEKQAGRLEERTLTLSSMLNDYLDWPHIAQVFRLERRFTDLATGRVWAETQYGLTSLSARAAGPERVLTIVRSEWEIESGLHYRRDVTFEEDRTRITRKSMGHVMAIVNNLVISLLNHQGFSNHAHARRVFDAAPNKALALLL